MAYSYQDPEGAITSGQIRAIHTVLSRNGINDETYRLLLNHRYQVSSSKALTRAQAGDLLDHLSGQTAAAPKPSTPMPRSPRPQRRSGSATVVGLITPEQRRLIHELVSEIHWHVKDGYTRWLRANQNLSHPPATRPEAARVIEGLKRMKRRQ